MKINNTNLIQKYFKKYLNENKNLKDKILAFEEILIIKKNIRKIFNTDNPYEIKKLIGKNINNTNITEKDYKYAKLIDDTYKKIYIDCKKILEYKNVI